MELAELEERLVPFARTKYDDPFAQVTGVHKMPGHAGFSYGFSVRSRGAVESWFLRLPPPNVQWKGTADVLRQVASLRALDGGPVPHCSVKWAGDGARVLRLALLRRPQARGRRAAARTRRVGRAVPARQAARDGGRSHDRAREHPPGRLAREARVPGRADAVRGGRHPLGPLRRARRRAGVDAARARGAREAPRLDPEGRADRPLPRRLQLAQHLLVEGRAACSR